MHQLSRTARLRSALVTVAVAGVLGVNAAATAPAYAHDEVHEASASGSRLTGQDRQAIHQATKKLRTPAAAKAADFLPSETCTALPGVGGMGYHFVNLANLADGVLDASKPEVLVFVPDGKGGLTLGAVEYMTVDGDQDLATDSDRPFLFGTVPFDGPMPGHEPGMPVHYDLHVWLYEHNPAGMFATWNPAVSC